MARRRAHVNMQLTAGGHWLRISRKVATLYDVTFLDLTPAPASRTIVRTTLEINCTRGVH